MTLLTVLTIAGPQLRKWTLTTRTIFDAQYGLEAAVALDMHYCLPCTKGIRGRLRYPSCLFMLTHGRASQR
jgi:hypothetical protein